MCETVTQLCAVSFVSLEEPFWSQRLHLYGSFILISLRLFTA